MLRQAREVSWVSWGPHGWVDLNNFTGSREKGLSSVVREPSPECGTDKRGSWGLCIVAIASESDKGSGWSRGLANCQLRELGVFSHDFKTWSWCLGEVI